MKTAFTICIMFFILFMGIVNSQTKDSCDFYSKQFKDDLNLCNGLVAESFRWLTSNCIILQSTTCQEVEEIFGKGGRIKVKIRTYYQYNSEDFHNSEPWFDYYWEYGLFFFCDENMEIKLFPSDRGIIYFKDNKVVKIGSRSIG